jgi:hypothetical protein
MVQKAMPLVPSAAAENNTQEMKRIWKDFVIMTVCFSMNHATISTVIAFAGADFQYLGHYSNVCDNALPSKFIPNTAFVV